MTTSLPFELRQSEVGQTTTFPAADDMTTRFYSWIIADANPVPRISSVSKVIISSASSFASDMLLSSCKKNESLDGTSQKPVTRLHLHKQDCDSSTHSSQPIPALSRTPEFHQSPRQVPKMQKLRGLAFLPPKDYSKSSASVCFPEVKGSPDMGRQGRDLRKGAQRIHDLQAHAAILVVQQPDGRL
jgi:hypothetical protein